MEWCFGVRLEVRSPSPEQIWPIMLLKGYPAIIRTVRIELPRARLQKKPRVVQKRTLKR